MEITLLAHTPEAKRVAFAAIRTCYSPKSPKELYEEEFSKYEEKRVIDKQTEDSVSFISDSDRLIRQIAASGHTSTLEHISFTFGIEGVSRAFLAQLTRHRIASYSVQSQRYVKQNTGSKHGAFDFVTPDLDYIGENKDEALKIFNDAMLKIQDYYDMMMALGVKAEDARGILPQAACTNIVFTMDLRNLIHFYQVRNKNTHAQAEIAEFAERIKSIITSVEPWTAPFFEV